MCQTQEEEERFRGGHLRGGDSRGRDPPHGKISQLLQPEMGREADSVSAVRLLFPARLAAFEPV